MTAAQTRLADTIDAFYGSADQTSDGAMAGHAYKRSVDDLDGSMTRELVSLPLRIFNVLVWIVLGDVGSTIPDDHI